MNDSAHGPSLRQKIGQMLLAGFRGLDVAEANPVAGDLTTRHLGGVILFDKDVADPSLPCRNIQSPAQVRKLTSSLRRLAPNPPFIAVDQEGGQVCRLKPAFGFPETFSQEELGARNDPTLTFVHASQMAQTLVKSGFNLNLAPVLDLAVNPANPIIQGKQRSFSADPDIVARHAIEFIKAHHQHGIMTCVKHFPGDGSAGGDTHLGLVDVTRDWTERELVPFQRVIEAGLCDAVMTAHIFNSHLDPLHPATLSKPTLDGILRQRLHFDGVIISDDMEMKAIAAHYGLERALQLGIDAGLDVLCFGNNMTFDPDIVRKAADSIVRLVETGAIPEARINQSFERIQKLKRKFGLI